MVPSFGAAEKGFVPGVVGGGLEDNRVSAAGARGSGARPAAATTERAARSLVRRVPIGRPGYARQRMMGIVVVGVVVTGAVASLALRRRWRRYAHNLHERHRIAWEEPPGWGVVEEDAEAWREDTVSAIARELSQFGFRRAGLINNASEDRLRGGECLPLTIFVREQGDVHVASHEYGGHDILELETELADGQVLATDNLPSATYLTVPPEFEIVHRPGASPSVLLREHQERVGVRARSSGTSIRPTPSLDDVIASQVRQHALKRRYRASLAFISDAEFEQIADALKLSTWGRREVMKEYRAAVRRHRQHVPGEKVP
jgi:hypothetical protein